MKSRYWSSKRYVLFKSKYKNELSENLKGKPSRAKGCK